MRWRKCGLIFVPQGGPEWMASYAAMPVADAAGNGVLRIYFGARDRQNHFRTAAMDVAADDPSNVIRVYDRPVLDLGRLGAFDDSGAAPSWIVDCDGRKLLYFIGWNPRVTVPYHIAMGLAISEDGGRTFRRYSEGPVRERSLDEPHFITTPAVLRENSQWRMWYTACTKWELIQGRAEPFYHIKHALSDDGLHWSATGQTCLDYDAFAEGLARPCVFKEGPTYGMIYSYRSATGYRTDRSQGYRLGYAESADGIHWRRNDNQVGIERSEEGWDSQMMEYAFLYRHGCKTYLFYNGNSFGQSGLGYAVLEEEKDPVG